MTRFATSDRATGKVRELVDQRQEVRDVRSPPRASSMIFVETPWPD